MVVFVWRLSNRISKNGNKYFATSQTVKLYMLQLHCTKNNYIRNAKCKY